MPNIAGSGNNLLLGAGRVYTQRWANGSPTSEIVYAGDVEKLTLTTSVNTVEKEGSTTGVRGTLAQDVISVKTELAFTANEWTKDNRAKFALGTLATWSQTSGTATDTALGNVKLGAGLSTGKRKITVTAVKKGAATLVAATSWGGVGDYFVDSDAGIIFFFDTPATAGLADGDAVTWSGSYADIASKTMISAMGAGVQTFSIIFVAAADQLRGPKQEVRIHKVSLTPDGAMDLISKDYSQLNFKAALLQDDSQPAGQQYYVIRDL